MLRKTWSAWVSRITIARAGERPRRKTDLRRTPVIVARGYRSADSLTVVMVARTTPGRGAAKTEGTVRPAGPVFREDYLVVPFSLGDVCIASDTSYCGGIAPDANNAVATAVVRLS